MMRLFDLGPAKWEDAVAIANALTAMRREGIVLVRPRPPVLCVGNLVNLGQVVDAEVCRDRGIPIVSSQSHTNALCLAQPQLELKAVLPRDSLPLDDPEIETFLFVLAPLLEACRNIGIDADFKPPNEIIVHGRRIATACRSRANRCTLVSASLAIDHFDSFSELLSAPDESLRTRMVGLMQSRRSSLRDELSAMPDVDALEREVSAQLRRTIAGLEPGIVDAAIRAKMAGVPPCVAGSRSPRNASMAYSDWNVDIGSGTELQQRVCKVPGGFLRVSSEWHNRRLVSAMLGGDFLCYPPGRLQRLEAALIGVSVGQLATKICEFYRETGWVTPGIQPGHWTKVLLPLSLEDYPPALITRPFG